MITESVTGTLCRVQACWEVSKRSWIHGALFIPWWLPSAISYLAMNTMSHFGDWNKPFPICHDVKAHTFAVAPQYLVQIFSHPALPSGATLDLIMLLRVLWILNLAVFMAFVNSLCRVSEHIAFSCPQSRLRMWGEHPSLAERIKPSGLEQCK